MAAYGTQHVLCCMYGTPQAAVTVSGVAVLPGFGHSLTSPLLLPPSQAKPNFFCKLLEVMTDDSIALVLSPPGLQQR